MSLYDRIPVVIPSYNPDEKLCATELVSMYSLKKYNPAAHIVLLTDGATGLTLKGRRENLLSYIDEHIVVETPKDFIAIQKSRFLKTCMRHHIQGDCLYIDNDTLITGDLSELENIDVELGAVYDNHRNDWNEKHPFPMVVEYYHCMGFDKLPSYNITHHFNGGLMYSKDTELSHKLYSKWHELWHEGSNRGFHSDQPSLWLANSELKNPIVAISGTYNCQVPYDGSLKFLDEAKILHYFSSYKIFQGFFMQDKQILQHIKNEGIDSRIDNLIENAKKDFKKNIYVLKGKDLEIYNSPTVVLARKISRDFPWTNKLAKSLYSLFGHTI